MASLIISYTPQFSSNPLTSSPFICHRICYKVVGVSDYCCVEDTTASVAGVPKTFTINIDGTDSPDVCGTDHDISTDPCSDTNYEGYVQACCEVNNPTAPVGAVYWSTIWYSDPDCVGKRVCCNTTSDLKEATFTLIEPGSGYLPSSTYVCFVIRDPLDTETSDGVVEVFTDGSGIVNTISVTTVGSYSKIPQVIVPAPGGGGTQAIIGVYIPCSNEKQYYRNCLNSGESQQYDTGLALGECLDTCRPKTTPYIYTNGELSSINFDFTYTDQGCCYCSTCKDYTVYFASNIEHTLCYTRCNDNVDSSQFCTLYGAGESMVSVTCAVPGSIYCSNLPSDILSIVESGGPTGCCPTIIT